MNLEDFPKEICKKDNSLPIMDVFRKFYDEMICCYFIANKFIPTKSIAVNPENQNIFTATMALNDTAIIDDIIQRFNNYSINIYGNMISVNANKLDSSNIIFTFKSYL